MKIAALEHLPLSALKGDKLARHFWDSPAYALNLQNAFEGFIGDKKFGGAGKTMTRKYANENGGVVPNPGGHYFMNLQGLQTKIHNTMMRSVFPGSSESKLQNSIAKRCDIVFKCFSIDHEHDVEIDNAVSLLGKMSSPCALKVIKTWMNGWATSARMHEEVVLECVLGCQSEGDCLSHYVCCPHLFAMQKFLCEDVSSNPLIRFGLKCPCPKFF